MNIDIKKASTNELVKFYNEHAPKKVKRFADRAAAEKRVTALLSTIVAEAARPMPGQSTPAPLVTAAPSAAPQLKGDSTMSKTKAKSKSAGVKSSWGDKSVAAARAAKHKVKVSGQIYRSVLEAFEKLKLDVKKHQAFRKTLKEQGRATFEGNVFTLVPHEA